jgi:hypothetical protein
MLHFTFYCLQVVFLLLHLISLGLHHSSHFDADLLLTLSHSAALVLLIGLTMSMPLEQIPIRIAPTAPAADVPDREVDDGKDEIYLESPEDRVTLGDWVVFGWVAPLLEKGSKGKLGYRDVWRLPSAMESEGIERSMKEITFVFLFSSITLHSLLL